jgi:hypothetical protein
VTELSISKMKEARMRRRGVLSGNAGNATSPYSYFRLNDTLNSVSLGALQQMLHLTAIVKVHPALLLVSCITGFV